MSGKAILFRALVLIVLGARWLGVAAWPVPVVVNGVDRPNVVLAQGDRARVYQATVTIRLQYSAADMPGAGGSDVSDGPTNVKFFSRSLGTLVTLDDHTLLVTHNHWPWLNAGKRPERMLVKAVEGDIEFSITGAKFFRYILHRDAGFLVLRIPRWRLRESDQLPRLSFGRQLEIGDIVHLTVHESAAVRTISIIPARIEAIQTVEGVHKLTLRNLNGQSLSLGDSGGGVWHDGRLAAVVWTRLRKESHPWWLLGARLRRPTDKGRAACMSPDVLHALSTQLADLQPPY